MANLERIKKLYQEAGQALTEGKALIAQYEGKEMPGDVRGQVDGLFDVCETKQKEARLLERHDGLDQSLNGGEVKRLGTQRGQLETPERRQMPGMPSDPQDTDEQKAFSAYLHGEMSPEQRQFLIDQKTALSVGSAGNGGYLAPVEYSDQLTQPLYDQSYLRMAGARIIPITAKSADFPTLTGSAAAVQTDEAANYDEKEPTTGHVTATPYKFTRISLVSEELMEDSQFPLWSVILNPDFAQAFAAAENGAFTTGDGSGHPQGVVTGASSGVVLANSTSQVSTIADADKLIDLYHALDYKYRPRAKWMLNDATLKIIRKFKDSTNQYIWQPALVAGQPDLLLGRPVLTNNSMATPGASNKTVLFGDFSYFWIFERAGLFIQQLVELYAGSGQIAFRAYKRFDSHVMLSAAIKYLQQAAS